MNKIYVGIDNGVSGSITFLTDSTVNYYKTPVKNCMNYTKKIKWLNRIDTKRLRQIFLDYLFDQNLEVKPCLCLIERPMINPARFQASMSAIRALEATLIVLEELDIPYMYIDAKEWQKMFLPKGIKGASKVKKATKEVIKRMYPFIKENDVDSVLIAEYGRRKNL